MLNIFTLKNGLKVATFSIPQMRSVFLSLAVKGGSIFDTQKTSGSAHFMEHMLVQGIPSLPDVESFSDYIESLSGGYGAVTYGQSVKFTMNAPASHLEDMLKISSEVFFEPLFPEDAMERERSAVLEEIKERQDALWYKNSRFFSQTRFKKGHSLLLDSAGKPDVVKSLTRDDLISYWKNFFFPKNTYLIIVGGFKNSEIRGIVKKYFHKPDSDKKFPGFPNYTNEDFSQRSVGIRHDPKLKTCYLDLTFPSISDNSPVFERVKQALIRNILGGLRRSRLYRLLRQRRGLVYHVGFGSVVFELFGYAYVTSQVSPEKLDEVLELIVKELAVFASDGPTEEELLFAKNHYINQSLMHWDHPSAISEWISDDLLWEEKIYTPEEYVKIIERVTMSNLQDFMKKYWDFAKLNLVIQGPVAKSQENIKKYERMLEELR